MAGPETTEKRSTLGGHWSFWRPPVWVERKIWVTVVFALRPGVGDSEAEAGVMATSRISFGLGRWDWSFAPQPCIIKGGEAPGKPVSLWHYQRQGLPEEK